MLDTDPLRCLFGEDVIASPYVFDKSGHRVSGCLYAPSGSKLELSERYGGVGGKKIATCNPDHVRRDQATSASFVPGHSVYLGHYMGGHYGHFLLESLSAAWILKEVSAIDHFVYHAFIFGTELTSFAISLLKPVGVDIDRLLIIEGESHRFERIVVPQRLILINKSVHVRMRETFADIRQAYASGDCDGKQHVYLSRRRLPSTKWRYSNEDEVERLFQSRGFDIVYPEELTLPEQVALYSNSTVVAGSAGSALHNVVFCRPGTTLIHVCDPRTPNSVLRTQSGCNEIAQANAVIIPFVEGDTPGTVSMKAIEEVVACGAFP